MKKGRVRSLEVFTKRASKRVRVSPLPLLAALPVLIIRFGCRYDYVCTKRKRARPEGSKHPTFSLQALGVTAAPVEC
jgi:hypothetical protein